MDALLNACKTGNPDKALVFAGEKVYNIREILPVSTIFKTLLNELTNK